MRLDAVREVLRRNRPREVSVEPGMIPAAVAIALREGDEGLEALFIHRAERVGDTWSGQIAFPGGRRDPADADLLVTAIREAREEIGVDLSRAEWFGALDDMHPRTPVLPPVVVRPFVFGLGDPPDPPALVLSPEVQDAFWVPLRVLSDPGVRREITVEHRGVTHVLPAYVVANRTIWGMTERIVTPLLELVHRV